MHFFKDRIQWIRMIMAISLLGSAWFLFSGQAEEVSSAAVTRGRQQTSANVVVVDAGHGGY